MEIERSLLKLGQVLLKDGSCFFCFHEHRPDVWMSHRLVDVTEALVRLQTLWTHPRLC